MRMHASSAALGAVALGLAFSGASAQQAEDPRGWLGVGVQELMQCRVSPSSGGDGCWKRLVVTQVVVDGPADRAGVQPGDTIVALDGDRLEAGLAAAALATVRPGNAVRLDLGRAGRRSTVRIVPGRRPTGTVAVRVPVAPGETGVVRRPVAPAAPRAIGERSLTRRILIRGEGGGLYQIAPHVEIRLDGPEGDGVVLQVDSGRIVEADGSVEAERLLSARGRWVQLDPGPELRALQDSVFRAARLSLDSLQRALRGNEARYLSLMNRMRREARGQLVWTGGFGRSVAGAEFEPLSPELAEFFEGADGGLLCLRVVEETPAHRLGLRTGDVVVEAAGRPVASLEDLREAFGRERDRAIEVEWLRKGRLMRGTLRY